MIIKWKRQWGGDDRVVWVIARKLDEAWQLEPGEGWHLPHGSCLKHRVGEWFAKAAGTRERIPMPHVSYQEGYVSFTDGRHRFGWCRDHGVKALPVSVSRNQAVLFKKLFGSKSRTCRVPKLGDF